MGGPRRRAPLTKRCWTRSKEWLWARWRIVERAGIDRPAFGAMVAGYRRELWLWLAGERTWEQCCSGLVGRIGRRYPV